MWHVTSDFGGGAHFPILLEAECIAENDLCIAENDLCIDLRTAIESGDVKKVRKLLDLSNGQLQWMIQIQDRPLCFVPVLRRTWICFVCLYLITGLVCFLQTS